MLRIETQESGDALIFKLQGRLKGEGAEQVRSLATRCDSETKLLVDLTDVMFVNAAGEEVLSFLRRLGAQFIAETAYALDVCERLRLPLGRNGISQASKSTGSDGDGSARNF